MQDKDIIQIDRDNIKIFKTIQGHIHDKEQYTCLFCKNKVSLDDTYSDEGHSLICVSCIYELTKHNTIMTTGEFVFAVIHHNPERS